MATQPSPPPHYRQEVIRLRAQVVDLVSRHAMNYSIPIPVGIQMYEVIEARTILNDSGWEVISADKDFVWFKRYMVGEYVK